MAGYRRYYYSMVIKVGNIGTLLWMLSEFRSLGSVGYPGHYSNPPGAQQGFEPSSVDFQAV